ncbi:phage portal protein [Petrimonas sulfuriphila]|uniref:phage portal protein n=1 Tax=Petrimonas sulfuriphila TaxID=285070 RepID=UPI003EB8E358
MKARDIKTKRVWKRVTPVGYMAQSRFTSTEEPYTASIDNLTFNTVTQADFLREFYPSGHAINDPTVYPDIYKEELVPVYDEETGDLIRKERRIYKEYVPRFAFSFQQIIALKQIVHLCGNDIQFELNINNPTDEQKESFLKFRAGWIKKDMELAFYEAAKSVKITGDTAHVGFISNGEFGYKTLSFLDGDVLYPHKDPITGEMLLFARSYFDYDEDGNRITEWLEVWDNTYLTRYKRSTGKTISQRILSIFGIDGYTIVSKKAHGFPFVPVAYKRDNDGACWTPSQDSIDGYELSFSQMAQNNQAYGFPILYLQGDGDTEIGKEFDMNGSIKVLEMGKDDKAGYLSAPNASESFMKQIDTLYKMIYEQSFTVIPPELKSGDLPAAALKILYSPAYEKATTDASEYQSFLNDMVRIFSYGYGLEQEKTINFGNLPMKWWIKPYVHVSESAMVADLAAAVQNGFVSKQTASEKISMYSTVSEWDRIIKEQKAKQADEMAAEIEKMKLTHNQDEESLPENS